MTAVRPEAQTIHRPMAPAGPASEPLVLGVAAQVAAELGVSARCVRAALALLATAGGFGVLVYVLAAPFAHRLTPRPHARTAQAELGLGLMAFGVALQLCSWWPGAFYLVVIPSAVLALGIAYGWAPIDLTSRNPTVAIALRVIVGGLLMLVATIALLSLTGTFTQIATATVWVLMAATGLALLAAPGVMKLTNAHQVERDARIREAERSAVAAHLHDSVLQTLTLISRNAGDAAVVTKLARQQERELRRWLYRADEALHQGEWPTTLQLAIDEVEDRYGITVELVTAGTGPTTLNVQSAIGAAREALVNAAKFSGASQVSVYAEQSAGELSVFVRDRGAGFDPAMVSSHRRGITDSIVARARRCGGHAEVTSTPGVGTEVIVSVPLGEVLPARNVPNAGPSVDDAALLGPTTADGDHLADLSRDRP
jgi:signal transduction histidine kinase